MQTVDVADAAVSWGGWGSGRYCTWTCMYTEKCNIYGDYGEPGYKHDIKNT